MAFRLVLLFCVALALTAIKVNAETRGKPQPRPLPAETHGRRLPAATPPMSAPQAPAQAAVGQPAPSRGGPIQSALTLADIGYSDGFRLANLGGRRELFLPMPQGADITATELVLTIDDVSAHDAKRSLEVLLNDRTVAAISLDGKGSIRTVRVPLGKMRPRDGFLKFSFLYSGAATQDRCIDVRYVGDSLTVRPETTIELAVDFAGNPDVATTAALMPREVAVVLPRRPLTAADFATALTVARTLAASSRRVSFHQGFELLPELVRRDDRRWMRGLIVIGSLQEAAGHLDPPVAVVAGPQGALGALVAARIGGMPALVVSDASAVRASRLLGSPALNATRGIGAATVGEVSVVQASANLVRFDKLGIVVPQAEVYGRADLSFAIDTRMLPPGTRPARLVLDVMVAPDGAGERAVVSAFVNDRLIGSTVAAVGEPTRLDLPLAEGLVGTTASVRVVVQRRSAQGDCRFEPQGYPAQILGSSAVVLEAVGATAHDFSDLVAHWSRGVEVLLPPSAVDRPLQVLPLLSDVAAALVPETAVLSAQIVASGSVPSPSAPFIAVSQSPPSGSTPRVRFDRGRVAVADKSGQTLLDLGGFSAGAVAQVVNAGEHPGLWIKPLAENGSLPAPVELKLDRGDVAFLDSAGVALALSTLRDQLVRVTYPEQVSWLTVADRFRPWLIGSLWALATVGFLFALQKMLRRRSQSE